MGEAGERVILKGSLGEALKVVAWLALAELVAIANSGWPQGVIIMLSALIVFTPALSVELRGMLVVLTVIVVTVVFARLTLAHRFATASAIYLIVAAAALAAHWAGGAKLTLDAKAASVTQFWATTRLPWTEVMPDVLSNLAGKPVAVVLKPAGTDRKPFYLPERYGLPPTELVALMNRIRSQAGAG